MGDARPIGLFDSGVGGLTVVAEIFRTLPQEAIIYFADSARFPYGGRPHEEIRHIATGLAGYLVDQGVKAIIVACNTSSSVALGLMRELFPVPIIGVLNPGARVAGRTTKSGRVGVIATEGTVRSGSYVRAIEAAAPGVAVFQQACPRLTELAERGELSGAATEAVLRDYLAPLQAQHVDALVFGCTHYPYFRAEIAKILGDKVALVDPAAATVQEMGDTLARHGQLREAAEPPRHRFVTSADPDHFRTVGGALLGQTIPAVELVPPEELPDILGEGRRDADR